MNEDVVSTVLTLHRIAQTLNVPLESLFASPAQSVQAGRMRIPDSEVRQLLVAFTSLSDIQARRRVLDIAAAEVRAERAQTIAAVK